MANKDAPQGARPLRHLTGGNAFRMNPYPVDSSNATAIFIGDFVKLEDDGNVAPAAAGNRILGVCGGVDGDYDNLTRRYLPATTAGTVWVYDDPDIVFAIQEDSVSATLAATNVGNLANHVAGTGSTTTSISAHELDSDGTGTGTAGLRILRAVDRADNVVGETNAEWEVVIYEHELNQHIDADGVPGV